MEIPAGVGCDPLLPLYGCSSAYESEEPRQAFAFLTARSDTHRRGLSWGYWVQHNPRLDVAFPCRLASKELY